MKFMKDMKAKRSLKNRHEEDRNGHEDITNRIIFY